MIRFLRSLTLLIFTLTIIFSGFVLSLAQNPPPPPPPPMPIAVGRYGVESDDKGSVVRGRAFYQNTTSPVRRGWIGLVKIRDLVEKRVDDAKEGVAVAGEGYGASRESNSYVSTNDEGEFVIKGVKAGIYQPTFKVQGILNPTYSDRENPIYPLITVDGISEVNAQIPARRGGSVSGRVSYYDGEPVIGAKVQVVRKKESERVFRYNYGDDNTTAMTDDRGFYHFAGLPDGDYFVQVIEPSIHNESNNSVQSYNMNTYSFSSVLTTFYPDTSKPEEARPISVSAGQEQGDINISIPNRRLFRISGTVVAKNTKAPLKNLQVTFQRNGDGEQFNNYYSEQAKTATSDEQGKWSFVDLPKGKYLVKVSQGRVYTSPGTTKTDKQTKFAPVTKEIEIDNDNIQDIIFELSGESAISGTVTVEGGKGFPKFLYLSAFDEQIKAESSTAVNGSETVDKSQPNRTRQPFRLGELAAGKYKLSVNGDEAFYVKSMTANGNVDLLNSLIEIGDGQEIGNVQIVLATDVGTIKGKISNFDSTEPTFVLLLPSVKVGVNMLTNARQGRVNKTGEFSIQAAPGEYFAVIPTRSRRPKDGKFIEWLTNLTADAPKVTVKANETATVTLDQPKD